MSLSLRRCPQSAIRNTQSAIEQSGRVDLNHRPPGPEPGALTGLRYAPRRSDSRTVGLSDREFLLHLSPPLPPSVNAFGPTVRLSDRPTVRPRAPGGT